MIAQINDTSLALIHWTTKWPEEKLTVVAKGLFDLAGAPIDEDITFGPADLVPVKRHSDLSVSATAVGKQRLTFGEKLIEGPSMEAFAPLPLDHPERFEKLGSYDERWLAERWPWYPRDFDIAFFNSAPKALQVDPPRGDEKVAFGGAVTRLPGLRLRAFLSSAERFDELPMVLDTIHLDVDVGRLALTWRGFTDVSVIEHIYLAREPLADEPLGAENHRQQLQLALVAQQPRRKRPRTIGANDNEPEADTEAEDLAKLRASLEQAVAPPEVMAAVTGATTMKQALASLMDLVEGDPKDVEEMLKMARATMRAQLEQAGEDPSMLDLEDEPADDEPLWTRRRVQGCAKSGESMKGADLRALDLSELDLTGANLEDAILSKVNLSKTTLYGANLDGATMPGVDLTEAVLGGATLVDADLSGAKATKIDLRDANLEGALFDDAVMIEAVLDQAKAQRASFYNADLTGARFERTDLTSAALDGAILHGASLAEATLVDASMQAIRGDDVSFANANLFRLRAGEQASLFRADLRGAKADESIWLGADLREAKLTLSELRRADFSKADLADAALDGANCADADFTACVLEKASMLGGNFAGACFTRANLARADARKANFYEAELWLANTKGTRLDEAHLAMTKLAPEGR